MDLTRATSPEIGEALDRLGVIWSFDRDGDVRVAHESNTPPWVDAAFYEFDPVRADFSMRGRMLNARFSSLPDGMIGWELPSHSPEPTAIARKIVSLYLMPRREGLIVQVHATIEALPPAHPIRIKLIPGREQVENIERRFPGFRGVSAGKNSWISCGLSGLLVQDHALLELIRECFQVGLEMFDGPFTGWAQRPEGA